eukprot:51441-Alexandrium_andersonii.AAC.1
MLPASGGSILRCVSSGRGRKQKLESEAAGTLYARTLNSNRPVAGAIRSRPRLRTWYNPDLAERAGRGSHVATDALRLRPRSQ